MAHNEEKTGVLAHCSASCGGDLPVFGPGSRQEYKSCYTEFASYRYGYECTIGLIFISAGYRQRWS
ncbi:unnamed protein product [Cuscuta europaea]|uniref:Uncharacterized protein n=1 Tax=Cuscuta europaea TaxID=41803 RepID=A0A9P1DZK6_CUSEU|nr:unnamed protein product [Cuscuta europaea]